MATKLQVLIQIIIFTKCVYNQEYPYQENIPYNPWYNGNGYFQFQQQPFQWQQNGYNYAPLPVTNFGQNNINPNPSSISDGVVDVSPEYHRRMLGVSKGTNSLTQNSWQPENLQPGNTYQQPQWSYGTSQLIQLPQPRRQNRKKYVVEVNTKNFTTGSGVISMKPVVHTRSYSTSLKRTYVYDPSKPLQTLNLTFVNGVLVTEPPSTTPEPITTTSTTTEYATTTEESEDPVPLRGWLI